MSFLLSPPIVFSIFFLLCLATFFAESYLSAKGKDSVEKFSPYSGGQNNVEHKISPDYSQFYPYAFFFTIMHVLVLIVSTAPEGVFTLPLLYVAAGVLSLVIIFRR